MASSCVCSTPVACDFHAKFGEALVREAVAMALQLREDCGDELLDDDDVFTCMLIILKDPSLNMVRKMF